MLQKHTRVGGREVTLSASLHKVCMWAIEIYWDNIVTENIVQNSTGIVAYLIWLWHNNGSLLWGKILKRRRKDNIKLDLQEVRWRNIVKIILAQGRDRWWAVVNVVMTFLVLYIYIYIYIYIITLGTSFVQTADHCGPIQTQIESHRLYLALSSTSIRN